MRTPYEHALASLSRRDVLTAAGRLGAAATLTPFCSRLLASPLFTAYPFSLGVASGDPQPDGVVLWTRLAPEPLSGGGAPQVAIKVQWEVALDEQFRTLARSGTAIACAELGHSVHVEVQGPAPARDYGYRFTAGGLQSPVDRTRTAPSLHAAVERLRFGVCSCNHYEQGYFTAYRYMADEHFDAIFHTGDYIYEYAPYAGKSSRTRSHVGDELFSLTDYRNRYALYKLDPDLQAVHASAPFIVTWDDHEVDNDWAGQFSETNTPPEIFNLRGAAAFQAYCEAMPLRRSSLPSGTQLQLYRQLRFGSLLSVNILDTRQYRARQACQERSITACSEFADPQRSMPGATQEHWLRRKLADSKAQWNVLAQQVPMFGRQATSASADNRHVMDKWSGYPAARERLIRDITAAGLSNVMVLSGDIHSHWAADVPTRMSDPEGPSAAVELTCTSISSGGDGSESADYWPSIRPTHPHVRFHNNQRGYLRCEVSPFQWQADFMVLDSVSQAHARLDSAARVVIEPDNSRVLSA